MINSNEIFCCSALLFVCHLCNLTRLCEYCCLIFIYTNTDTEIFLWNGRILLKLQWWLLSLSLSLSFFLRVNAIMTNSLLFSNSYSPAPRVALQVVIFVPTIEVFQLVWSVCQEWNVCLGLFVIVVIVCSQHLKRTSDKNMKK